MKKNILARVFAGVVVCLLLILTPQASARAESAAIYSVDIVYELQKDGSALVREQWDVNVVDGTEWYIPKYNMGPRKISAFAVTDESGQEYRNIGQWDVDASIEEKAQKCGLVKTQGGYELCWGVGSYGPHKYTISYTIENAVMGYEGADGFYMQLLPKDLFVPAQKFSAVIKATNTEMTQENTALWVFGVLARFNVENGAVHIDGDGALAKSDYVVALLGFDKGMFNPLVNNSEDFEEIKEEAMQGSRYKDNAPGKTSALAGGIGIALLLVAGLFGGLVSLAIIFVAKAGNATGERAAVYKNAPYCRELPYRGSVLAAYARLGQLKALDNQAAIIGAYLLRWIQGQQVQLTSQAGGVFGNKEEAAMVMTAQSGNMQSVEAELYGMMKAAAGSDGILQSKEFEKWSQKNYQRVQGWLEQCNNQGAGEMRAMGATTDVQKPMFFGMFPTKKTVQTPLGMQLSGEMFGFKNYLSDFTIVNERQAQEVHLWNDYLVFAQLFGIADQVAEQFKQLHPKYFTDMATQAGYGGPSWFDIYMINRMVRSYSHAMSNGYQAGLFSGTGTGGGSFHSGGGGFSGGGFSSGGGSR